MATQAVLSHPGLDRLGRSYDAAGALFHSASVLVRSWNGWSRMAVALESWNRARIESMAMQDPRVRAEIQAAAQRMTHDDVR